MAVFSIEIRPFMYVRALSVSTPFASSWPVVSRPTWRVYDVRSMSCSSEPNTISTCSTVLRSPARTLSTRERTSRAPRLEHDVVRAELLEAGHREAGARAHADLGRGGQHRL